MTPSGYNGTVTVISLQRLLDHLWQVTLLAVATVFGTATTARGAAITVTAGQYDSNYEAVYALSGTPPSWQCYPGAMWYFQRNQPNGLQRRLSALVDLLRQQHYGAWRVAWLATWIQVELRNLSVQRLVVLRRRA